MARKSRRQQEEQNGNPVTIKEITLTDKIATGAYVRISVEKEEDDSVNNQVLLVKEYIASQENMELKDIYIDNGYSGTNFERPEFTRLMDDARSGRIDCIVVKDLSRLGRNFLETGYYIETLFPRLNIRLIAVTDHFDSSREEDRNSIAVPIKNMVNELYAKDFSKKMSAISEMRMRQGTLSIGSAVYGYKVNKEENRYEVNRETAPYVQLIFRWFLMGYGTTAISDRLHRFRVLTPYQYKQTKEYGRDKPENDQWNSKRVRDILKNQIYVGDVVHGKRKNRLYENYHNRKTSPEEWIVFENEHEPLVSRSDFEKVQTRLTERKVKMQKGMGELVDTREMVRDSFPKMVRCMECGCGLSYIRYSHEKDGKMKQGAYYVCKKYRRDRGCGQKIHEDYLRLVVGDQIKVLIQAMCNRKKLLEKMQTGGYNKGALHSVRIKIKNLQYQYVKAEDSIAKLYMDFSEGIVDTDTYQLLKMRYQETKEKVKAELKYAEKKSREIEDNINKFLELAENLEQHLSNNEYEDDFIRELVDTIWVSADGAIEVRFRCEDVYKNIMDIMEGCETEWEK